MTESKKKPVKKEKVEKIEEELKPAKRARIKEVKAKPVKQVIEEEILPPEEEPSVLAETAEKTEDLAETVKEEVSMETDQPSHEKKARISTHEPEPEKEVEFTLPVAEVKHIPSAEEFDWENSPVGPSQLSHRDHSTGTSPTLLSSAPRGFATGSNGYSGPVPGDTDSLRRRWIYSGSGRDGPISDASG